MKASCVPARPAICGLFVAALLAGCGSGPSTADRPDSVADAARPPGYVFQSLPRLIATSEIVVAGTVRSSEKGARVVPDDNLYHRKLVLQVDEQFYGAAVGSTVVVHEGGYNGDESFELREQPWLYPGDRAVYFLARSPEAKLGHYDIVAAPGRFAIVEDTVSSHASDPIARRLDGTASSALEDRLRNAARAVRERDVQPLPPGPFGEIDPSEEKS